jgi:uncharacterized glyoxalase superfamily protein PhnB
MAKPVPEGFHTVTPHLVVRGAAEALAFYRKAFGAIETFRLGGEDGGSVMHAEMRIGSSIVFLTDEHPEMGSQSPQALGGTPVTLHLFVEDVDAAFKRAIDAGAKSVMEPADMFWGDRYGRVMDPYGHSWSLATHLHEVSYEEMKSALAAMQSHG